MAALILAAGRSSRLGFPKALAPVEGGLALQRAVALSRAVGFAPVLVVLGHHASQIRDALPDLEADVVLNPDPDRGQTSSLVVGLAALPADVDVCLFPVDHARIAERTLRHLRDRFRQRRDGREVVLPSDGARRGHPILVSSRVAAELRELAPQQPAHEVIRRDASRLEHVVLSDPYTLKDIDTVEDLEDVD